MKIVFMGTPIFAATVLEGLIKEHDVIGIVTQIDKKAHRGKLIYSPVKELALKHDIKLLQLASIKKEFQEVINLKPDLIVTCAYGQIIPKELLDYPKYSCLNVHASLLPKYRGGAPIHRSIMAGEAKTGITIMYMNERMDEGDIISQEELIIEDSDTLKTVHDKLSIIGRDLLLKTIKDLKENKVTRKKQDENLATYAPIITKEDELIDFNQEARTVFNHIRALNPFPGAYTKVDGKNLKIYDLALTDQKSSKAGKVTKMNKEGLFVSTLDYDIMIREIKYEGSKKMSVRDFLNGNESFEGKVLGE